MIKTPNPIGSIKRIGKFVENFCLCIIGGSVVTSECQDLPKKTLDLDIILIFMSGLHLLY